LLTSSRRKAITYPDRGGAYQYFNQVSVIKPMSKWSGSASEPARVPELLRRAMRMSYKGRPGVVHLDVPEDIINGREKYSTIWDGISYRNREPLCPASGLVEKAAALLVEAELPVIHAGSGVIHAGAYEELKILAEMLHAPVTTSWSGRGVLPETHELSMPMVLVETVNETRKAADVALILGSRVGETDWWGKAPYWRHPSEQRTIQVDIDEEVLGLNRPVELAILGDVKLFLTGLISLLKEKQGDINRDARQERVAQLIRSREKARAKLDEKLKDTESPMVTAHVPAVAREVMPDDTVVVFDGGNTAVWGNFYFQVRHPNTQLSTHHFGHLGAGIGQALGAAAARPDSRVLCIIGDGAFGFHPQEIETAVRNNLKVIFMVICDKQWGMVKMTQQFALKPLKTMIKKSLAPEETINADLGEIAFDKLAESMGAYGARVSSPGELKEAIMRAVEAETCAVIHVDVDPVKHMWAPGLLKFKDMHQEPSGK
ncbi:MAG: thiamine pyrophosphate-binding protein, partial [Deltaproteobacteria bacterium]|nr:thiamine pyrophosphate-binding protein [Deltaproteobacteria bacterium]